MSDRARVLVKEKIADSGVEQLQELFDVDLGIDMSDEELLKLAEGDPNVLEGEVTVIEETQKNGLPEA